MDEFTHYLSTIPLSSIIEQIEEQEEYGIRGTYDSLIEERERRFSIIEEA